MKRFLDNLGECVLWTGITFASGFGVFILYLFIGLAGGAPGDGTLEEMWEYIPLGVQRIFLFFVLPLLACASFKTWVLKR